MGTAYVAYVRRAGSCDGWRGSGCRAAAGAGQAALPARLPVHPDIVNVLLFGIHAVAGALCVCTYTHMHFVLIAAALLLQPGQLLSWGAADEPVRFAPASALTLGVAYSLKVSSSLV